MSTSPAASKAALPLEEPPAMYSGFLGFLTDCGYDVCDPLETQRFSHVDLPVISPPASSILVTTVASTAGTKPVIRGEPFWSGMPATAMLSLIAIFFPESFPGFLRRRLIEHLHAHAPNGFSLEDGRCPPRLPKSDPDSNDAASMSSRSYDFAMLEMNGEKALSSSSERVK